MPKKLGLWTVTSLVFGNMVGAGIFILPANLANIGSISLFSWVITATGSFLLALVFARMSVLVPKSGGPYAYTQTYFGDFIGFQTACNYWFQVWVGNAGIAIALVGYLIVFFPFLNSPHTSSLAAIAMVWILTLFNMMGIKHVGALQLVTTIAKFIPLILIGVVGWWYFHPYYLVESFNVKHTSNFSALSSGVALTLWGFIGLESATVSSEHVKNPKRNIPLATLLGTAIAALIYMSTFAVLMGMLPHQTLASSPSPFADAAIMMFGNWSKYLVAAGAVISALGSLNGWTFLQGQIALAAANDNLFPSIFRKLNRNHLPAIGLTITSLFTTGLLLLTMDANLVSQFNLVALLAILASLIPYLYTALAAILAWRRSSNKQGLTRNVIQLTVAGTAAIYVYWALFGVGEKTIFYGSLLLFGVMPFYVFMRKSKIPNPEVE